MPRTDAQYLGSELAKIKRAIKDLQSGRLKNASMHGGRLYVYDDDGDVREVIGNQGDGSYGSRVIQSPDQPTCTAPILPASDGDERVSNVFPVRWDGGIVQGVVPVVHGRVDVWTQKLPPGEEPDPSAAVLSGSIRDQQGGVTDVVVQGAGNYAVWLQMVGADRVTKGEFSQPAVVDVTALVDTERLEGALQGDLPDGIYNSLMARLAEYLYVRADQIDVNSLAADTARMNELWTGLAVISEAQIDDLLGNSAKFKTIEGAEIVGSTYQTSRSIFGSSSGGVRISGVDGEGGTIDVTNINASRVFRAGADGVLIAGDIDLSGSIRVGGSGEGGIIPSGSRTRFVGRTPSTTGPTDTMAYGRTGQLTVPTSRTRVTVTYETPVPESARVPLVSIHRPANQMTAVWAHTQSRNDRSFQIIVNASAGASFWVYYLAYWGDPPNSPGSVEAS